MKKCVIICMNNRIEAYVFNGELNTFEVLKSGKKFKEENINEFWNWFHRVVGYSDANAEFDLCVLSENGELFNAIKFNEVNTGWDKNKIEDFVKNHLSGFSVSILKNDEDINEIHIKSLPQCPSVNLHLVYPQLKHMEKSCSNNKPSGTKGSIKTAFEKLYNDTISK